jgi:hypothetical protein
MTDTPETDDLARGNHVVPTEFAEKLERERDEAQRKVAELQAGLDEIEEYGTEEINAAVDLRHQLAVALCERDEAREHLDRLAEALRMITTFDYTDLQCDNGHGARSVATEALQSLTPNKS